MQQAYRQMLRATTRRSGCHLRNYIEGEISFDILDDNEFEDIATTNRQDFSIVDERVKLLLDILRSLCRQLLQRRQELADKITDEKQKADDKIQSQQKSEFAHETQKDLLSAGIATGKASELSFIIANKLQGVVDLKSSYKLFISHSTKDRIFTDFISNYIKYRGFRWHKDVDKTDIFYSSDGTDITDDRPLADIIKKMIIDANTDILFLTSQNFSKSQYCLFEGGAAWATRAILQYGIIALDYDSIPKFLTNNKSEFTFNMKDRGSFVLNEQNYSNIVVILNRLIAHLNKNRIGAGETQVTLIPSPSFEDRVKMDAAGKCLKDYMAPDVCKYWETYVIRGLDKYLRDENGPR